ncbi:hypothetical protein EOS_35660 [Caballeronia mineralivorans PML1(12)]|uniref:Ribosomal protein S14 n=1 Tax=Caballeronia mineralivorans PML1(12) TaxID=908627 RepID=A0A0J1CLA6_9BURK|nr:DUF3331 domain-containing protein [Caballeronia mineralivorans]KLU21507.1 hypothetical protein EOS_35660 [Caballeronia mineralivorans PML1(12)]
MLAKPIANDPWSQALDPLTELSGVASENSQDATYTADKSRQPMASEPVTGARNGVVVTVIDRPAPGTATVAWCDPTSCRYGDQVWRVSVARESAVCALSGNTISPGDAVYRPRASKPLPINASAMILASLVEAACSKRDRT